MFHMHQRLRSIIRPPKIPATTQQLLAKLKEKILRDSNLCIVLNKELFQFSERALASSPLEQYITGMKYLNEMRIWLRHVHEKLEQRLQLGLTAELIRAGNSVETYIRLLVSFYNNKVCYLFKYQEPLQECDGLQLSQVTFQDWQRNETDHIGDDKFGFLKWLTDRSLDPETLSYEPERCSQLFSDYLKQHGVIHQPFIDFLMLNANQMGFMSSQKFIGGLIIQLNYGKIVDFLLHNKNEGYAVIKQILLEGHCDRPCLLIKRVIALKPTKEMLDRFQGYPFHFEMELCCEIQESGGVLEYLDGEFDLRLIPESQAGPRVFTHEQIKAVREQLTAVIECYLDHAEDLKKLIDFADQYVMPQQALAAPLAAPSSSLQKLYAKYFLNVVAAPVVLSVHERLMQLSTQLHPAAASTSQEPERVKGIQLTDPKLTEKLNCIAQNIRREILRDVDCCMRIDNLYTQEGYTKSMFDEKRTLLPEELQRFLADILAKTSGVDRASPLFLLFEKIKVYDSWLSSVLIEQEFFWDVGDSEC